MSSTDAELIAAGVTNEPSKDVDTPPPILEVNSTESLPTSSDPKDDEKLQSSLPSVEAKNKDSEQTAHSLTTEVTNDLASAKIYDQPEPQNHLKPDAEYQKQSPVTSEGIVTTDSEQPSSTSKKSDDKLAIFKALAIKLKKELVKTRDELQRVQTEKEATVSSLETKIQESLAKQVDSDTRLATLDATVKHLRNQLDSCEKQMQSLHDEYENYKNNATKIMQQQNGQQQTNSNKTFEGETYKQLKQLNHELQNRIASLESQLLSLINKNLEYEKQTKLLESQLEFERQQTESFKELEREFKNISRENESLKYSITRYRERTQSESYDFCDKPDTIQGDKSDKSRANSSSPAAREQANHSEDKDSLQATEDLQFTNNDAKDEYQVSSGSSSNSTISGYVHIKPIQYQIPPKPTSLDEANQQIEGLTKAYLDSAAKMAHLSEQLVAMQEELRKYQVRDEKPENFEYLKNVVFKFLSLDSSQSVQRQRLVPVLSTLLKLNQDEVTELSRVAAPEKGSVTSWFLV